MRELAVVPIFPTLDLEREAVLEFGLVHSTES